MTNLASRIDDAPAPIRTGWRGTELHLPPNSRELRPLSIGAVSIGFPVVQAALSGYSDQAMRLVARRLGASYTLAEVMLERFVLDLKDRHKTRRHLALAEEDHPIGGQLMGASPEDFGPAAKKLVAAGFDVIDINFGCPVKSAAEGCRGGYHLGQPDRALEIISRTREAVPQEVPVTLKMRRGIDDSSESHDNFFRILDGAFERGLAAVTVHGRTVAQKYNGPSNWDFLRAVKRHVGTRTILGSGDLFTPVACLEMLHYTGVDGVSVARGAIGNPWIFTQVRALAAGLTPLQPDLSEQRRVLEMHCALSVEARGFAGTLPTMRLFGIKYSRLHPEAASVRSAFALARTLADWRGVLDEWYPPTMVLANPLASAL
ncbi:MAG: tRNA dihydrouridine synthase [Planctomycetales bacterium]